MQAGAYGEHRFRSIRSEVGVTRVGGNRFEVLLGRGAGGTLEIDMDLFVNQPRFRGCHRRGADEIGSVLAAGHPRPA